MERDPSEYRNVNVLTNYGHPTSDRVDINFGSEKRTRQRVWDICCQRHLPIPLLCQPTDKRTQRIRTTTVVVGRVS